MRRPTRSHTATPGFGHGTSSITTALTVTQATPSVFWSPPAEINTGTALSGAQLDATASVPGVFTYTPPAGTILTPGQGQILSATFTPTDTTDYTTASGSTTINVGTPTLSGLSTATITYGTATTTLSGQITAGTLIPSGSVAIAVNGVSVNAPIDPTTGVFSSGFPTATLGVGGSPYTIVYSFPGDPSFAPTSNTNTLTVTPATPTLTVSGGPFVYNGTGNPR